MIRFINAYTRVFLSAAIVYGVCSGAAIAGVVTLSLATSATDATSGTWSVYATITNTVSIEDPLSSIVGISSFNIDVTGTDGVHITSSTNKSPVNGSYGFSLFRTDGTAGSQISSGQNTLSLPSSVLSGIGLTSGSSGSVSWTNPALLAMGTYSDSDGGLGTITAAAHSSGSYTGVNLLYATEGSSTWGGDATDVEAAGSVLGGIAVVPEPSTYVMIAGAVVSTAGALFLCRRRRRDKTLSQADDTPLFDEEAGRPDDPSLV